ncbi:hypothetical protein [Rhodococcus sp. SGAir0479]|uniref:hypothetical protein n=1 Tax=Rhodococcus sp. SGAir0479 TaxID=2567884 RepID=UPI0010CCB174|nr:hypothetical protein [Rhodococcus sp. SGAir0479]QCQ91735.1 hypothetical protein E7742_11160 [Rhodococcus sp. SGAir0479]
MRKLPEKWTLLADSEPTIDPVTNNRLPGRPIEIPWTGLLQQRQLTSSSIDVGNTEIENGHETSGAVLLLDPGIPRMPQRRDRFRGEDGTTYQVVGTPRPRRPARGSRRVAYIAAIVRSASDMKE